MSEHPEPADDAFDDALAAALGHEPARQPPADGVARVRAEAAARASRRSSLSRTTGRRDLLIGGIAASAGALAGAAAAYVATRGDSDRDDVPTEPVQFAFADDAVRSTASLINHTWGVELVLEIEGVPAGPAYQVAYERRDEPAIDAGSFIGVAAPMNCRFNAASLRADTTAIVIRDADGTEIGRADLS